MQNKQNETNFPVENNLPKNFPVNAKKGAQVLALVFVIGAAVFTNGDQTAIAANASVQPHSGILISTPPPPPTHNLKARKGAYIAGKGHSRANTFADFYKQTQIELLSALDNVLSQKAEDTLNQFAAVKKAEVNFQTSLGERKGQLGINLIGAFAESQNHGIGWQVRVFGGEKSSKGANAGIFYRRFNGDILFGGNVFLDYEDNDLGTFSRYSIGGELQNQYGSFVANYYVPITDEKRKNGSVIFSRKGYDAKLRLDIPNAKFLKAAVDYYNFGEEHGAESDDGFRYGAEAHLIPGLRIALLYDNGEKELGGEVSYTHTIGEVQQSQTANAQWTPDLFAAVSREHSQRIVSVGNVSSPPPMFNAFGNRAIVGTPAIIGAINISAGYTIGMLPQGLAQMGGTLTWNSVVSGAITFGIEVNNASQTTTLAIAATGYVEVGRVANVNATTQIEFGIQNLIISITTKFSATLPPAGASRPFILTITANLNALTAEVLQEIAGNGFYQVGRPFRVGGLGIGTRPWTLTIVQGSEEYQSTLYAQADIDSHLPPSFPLSFPQMPKLAFADPVILARRAGIQTFSRHSRVGGNPTAPLARS